MSTGPPRAVDDRGCTQDILFVSCAEIPWRRLPLQVDFGSGQTCQRVVALWHEAGVLDTLLRILLAKLNVAA
ncbi:transposase [Streptomyces sp. 3MP-14]|uniref:Transposase n=1 Tax=Streptomyces mimosae TaxID=2586635 RepID=A0A5N6ACN5_9ACTN|nr:MULTISPECIES: transposase [Streptomyces]KAB8166421.1 transposase [Streptomyces mimosae]KAB8174214.1 transposase [Streptomyces sp. 3MP-14]